MVAVRQIAVIKAIPQTIIRLRILELENSRSTKIFSSSTVVSLIAEGVPCQEIVRRRVYTLWQWTKDKLSLGKRN